VTFDIDANGILNVSAKDKATNKEQKITIQSSTGLTKEEAEKMRTEAESHAEDDRRRMEEVEARNRLDGIVYQAEKMVRENRDKIGEADAKSLEAAIEDAKKAMSEGEGGTARLRSATRTSSATAQGCGGAVQVPARRREQHRQARLGLEQAPVADLHRAAVATRRSRTT